MRRLVLIISVVLAALLSAPAQSASWPKPLAEYIPEFDSCILVYQLEVNLLTVQNPERCALPLSPCSTYKIPHAMIALDSGVLKDPAHQLPWDGKQRARKATNRDHNLATAIRHSVVWYFQQVAQLIGTQRMQDYLDRLAYGNRDISGGIDRFWLSSSLKINAYQQLEFLKQLKAGTLPASSVAQEQVRNMLILNTDVPGMLRGKTGSCRGNPSDHGWFVGWLTNDDRTTFFVSNIVGKKAWGIKLQRYVYEILKEMKP